MLIREWFKGVYAPMPSRQFHPKLGTVLPGLGASPIPCLLLVMNSSSLADRILPVERTESSPPDDIATNNVPSLLAHLSHQGHSFRKLPVCQVFRLDSSESESRGTSRSQSSSSRQCSRSPVQTPSDDSSIPWNLSN